MVPRLGVEIEFYLSNDIKIPDYENILGIKLKAEKGHGQFEIDLPPSTNLIEYINLIKNLKKNIIEVALRLGGKADLRSKPFINDYGNSVHYHIDFIQKESLINHDQILDKAARSLCNYMLDTFLVFMPLAEDYLRINRLFMAPTHVSYGGNNRTTAIRFPDTLPKRLEHRIACPTSDPYLIIFTILKSILLGLKFPSIIPNFPKIYGNAYESQYNLIPFPKSIHEAKKLFRLSFFDESFII